MYFLFFKWVVKLIIPKSSQVRPKRMIKRRIIDEEGKVEVKDKDRTNG